MASYLQAAMTLVGNFTLLAAAWWIWRSTQSTDVQSDRDERTCLYNSYGIRAMISKKPCLPYLCFPT
jgi:hypothetical protein